VLAVFLGTECMVFYPFLTVGNQLYPEFWVVIGGPWYPGYITLTLAPEPSVERVARVGHSIVGKQVLIWYYGHFYRILQ
jgi:hypothetical protein